MPDHDEIYARHADMYERMIARQPKLAEEIASIRGYRGLDVVDLGAGTGRLAAVLAPDVRTLTALDRSPAMLEVMERKLRGLVPERDWRTAVADHRALPLQAASADLVVSGWTIAYLASSNRPAWRADLDKVLGEIDRVLREDGTVVIFETLGTGVLEPVRLDFLKPYYDYLENEAGFSHRSIRMDYTFDSVEQAAELCGFFFGDWIVERIRANGWRIVPEYAGMWWKHKEAGRR